MASLPKPNQLRYRFCDIPPNVETNIQKLVDEFYVDMLAIDKFFDDFAANEVPGILAAEQQMADGVQELLRGAPIVDLSSLQALQDNLFLNNPKLPEDDPNIVRNDERKLGAVGMLLINGKMFALAPGRDFETFRQIWFAAQGEYQAFLALGDGIADSADGDFTLLQYVPGHKAMPYINRKWSVLDNLVSYQKLSKYVQPLIWTSNIDASAANYTRLKDIGYSDTQVSQLMAGDQPQNTAQVQEALFSLSAASMKKLAALYMLPLDDPQRQPKWANETKNMFAALSAYLAYRRDVNLTSHVFNVDQWERAKATFNQKDFKEIFEFRPEVLNVQVPTDTSTLTNIITAASAIPVGSTLINSYMINLPTKARDLAQYEERLLSVGTSLLKSLLKDKNPSSGRLTSLLEELKGAAITEADITPPDPTTANDIKNILAGPDNPSASVGSGGDKVAAVGGAIKNSPDAEKTKDALAAIAKTLKKTGAKSTQGLPTEENFMTILFRRVKWDQNFTTCTGKVKDSSNAPGIQETNDKFTKFGPALNSNIKTGPGGSASPDDLYGSPKKGETILSNPKNLGKSGGKPDLTGLPTRGADRRTVIVNQGANPTTIKQKFEYTCVLTFHNGFLDALSDLTGKVTDDIIKACEALKRALFMIQNIVDNLIAKAQVVLDQVLGVLERLLSVNLNVGGALGFETSIIKCAWSVDFSLKLDLFGELLKLLNKLFEQIFGPLREGLRGIQDIITKAICIPVRLIELLLGGIDSLLGLIGCALKEIKLPQAILDLLKALLATFDLRSLVLRGGYDAVFQMTLDPKTASPFQGLTQFAQLCQSVTMKEAVDSISSVTASTILQAPGFIAKDLREQAETATGASTKDLSGTVDLSSLLT